MPANPHPGAEENAFQVGGDLIDDLITPNFRLSEFLDSATAIRRGLDNTPTAMVLANIRNILAPGIQEVRDLIGHPVFISSGYRSPEVNAAVGGSPTSQHTEGLAADFKAPGFGMPSSIVRYLVAHAARLPFDQLIHEGSWVHISFVQSKPRHQVLVAHFAGGSVTYTPWV